MQTPSPPKPRRSQVQRRADMRRTLVEATLDSLQASGFHGASLGDILARAGVSRGAWAHHFASKTELVAAAATDMLDASAAEAATLAAGTGIGDDRPPEARLAALLEAVWHRFYQGRHRDVLFELAVACRTDADLRERLTPVFARLLEALGRTVGVALDVEPDDPARATAVTRLTVYMLRGMAMQQAFGPPSPDDAALRALWADTLARTLLGRGTP